VPFFLPFPKVFVFFERFHGPDLIPVSVFPNTSSRKETTPVTTTKFFFLFFQQPILQEAVFQLSNHPAPTEKIFVPPRQELNLKF